MLSSGKTAFFSFCALTISMIAARPAAGATFDKLGPSATAWSGVFNEVDGYYYVVSREAVSDSNYRIKKINPKSGVVSYEGHGAGGLAITTFAGQLYVTTAQSTVWVRDVSGNWYMYPNNLCNGGAFYPDRSLGKNTLAVGDSTAVWAIGSDKKVYYFDGRNPCWVGVGLPTGVIAASSIAINYDASGSYHDVPVITATSTNQMYDYKWSQWENFHTGGQATDLAGWLNRVEVLGTPTQLFWHWSGSSWSQNTLYSGNSSIRNMMLVPPNSTEWGAFVDTSGQVWHAFEHL